jgi:hypothetical protein
MPSITTVFGAATESETWSLGAAHLGVWNEGRVRYIGDRFCSNAQRGSAADRPDVMHPETPQPLPALLGYYDPSPRRRVWRHRVVRGFSGFLAVSSLALAFSLAQGRARIPVLALGVCLLAFVAALLALRTVNRCKSTFRLGWISAVVIFGLWTAIFVSNQTHGRPPPSDRFYILAFGLSCVLSAVALALDLRPQAAKG